MSKLLPFLLLLVSCNCNRQKIVPPSPVETIEQKYNPIVDSLKLTTTLLLDSIGKLNTELAEQKSRTAIAEGKANQTSNRLRSALNEKDTVKVLVYADNIIEEYNDFVQETNKQDSIQEAIIEKQSATIETNRAEIQIHESKYQLLKTAYSIQEIQLSDAARENQKLAKKLMRAKFWNKALGIGTAAGAVFAGILFL